MTELVTTKPGDKYRSIKNPRVYEALRREGHDKTSAARISNAQKRRKQKTITTKETPKATVDRLWASGVRPDDIIGIWYSPADGAWFVSGGDWATPGTGEKVKAIFGPGVEWADEGVPDETKFTQRLKSYTLDDLEHVALKEVDPVRAAIIATHLDQTTLKGEQLAPGVTRIRGNLCNVHGRWGSCSAAGYGRGEAPVKGYKPLPKGAAAKRGGGRKGGAGKGRAAAKPKKTEAQRQAEQAARHTQSQQEHDKKRADARQSVIDAMAQSDQGLAPNIAKAMLDFADGKSLDGAIAKGLAGVGLVETGPDGQPHLTEAGRMAAHAMDRGDVRGALDAINRGAERTAAATKRTQAAADRETARMQREIEKRNKKGGGHGGKGKKPTPTKAPTPPSGATATPRAPQAPKAGGGGGGKGSGSGQQLPAELLDAIQALSEGKPIDDATANKLVQNGLAWRRPDGTVALTVRGSRALRTKSFTVFKDASGAYRWIARTTTAYRDRDNEIISIKALEEDAARMTASGQYGPLRYWHVGQPNPLNAEAPWGPGLDIGDCDFSIVIGRTSIESGTFKSAEIGAAFAESADEYELSPGFFHAIGEPDASSVFNHIRRFERSPVPVKHGRASNLFTGLTTVKEHHMDQQTYEARVKTYLDFAREKGVPPEIAAAPLAAMQQADKTAEERHVAYKEAGPIDWLRAFFTGEQPQVITKEEMPPERTPDLHPDAVTKDEPDPAVVTGDVLAALKEELASLRTEVAALKAPPPPPMDAEDDPAQGGDAGADEVAEGEPPIDEGDGGQTLSADDLAAIGQVISATLEPLIGALGITQKLEGHLGELKTMMSGYTTQKDAAQATQTEEIATLKASIEQQQAKLTELTGDQPRASYRPTQAADNTPWNDPRVQAAIKENGGGNGFEDLTSKLFPGILPPN